MKKYFYIAILLFLSSCNTVAEKNPTIIHDTIPIVYVDNDSISHLNSKIDSLQNELSSLKAQEKGQSNISLEDYQNRYKLAQIQRYVLLCEKRPANRTFFFGWVKRALK